MAKYAITQPTYLDGVYFGPDATLTNPVVIDVRDDRVPSKRWDPLDEKAQAALAKIGVKKTLHAPPEPKAEVKQAETNSEMAAQRGGKVVGRLSDKSPV